MRQAASVHDVVVHMLLPSISINTRPTRFAPINQEQMVRFNGTSLGRFGDVRTAISSHVQPRAALGPAPRT
jgi:branched-chain amino acid transport system substrate-binding protein